MSWASRVKTVLDRNDLGALEQEVEQLQLEIYQGKEPAASEAPEVLKLLRKHRRFEPMLKVAEALIQTGRASFYVQRPDGQGLIETGRLTAATHHLLQLSREIPEGHPEYLEARGLLGRAYKQSYVDTAALGSGQPHSLRQAISAYHDVYAYNPDNYWHGINVVALLERARTDGVASGVVPDPSRLAENVQRTALREAAAKNDVWAVATLVEVCLALGQVEESKGWLERYVQHPEASAFHLGSTARQLREVWGLRADEDPGRIFLNALLPASLMKPDLQSAAGAVRIGPEEQAAADQLRRGGDIRQNLERILGEDGIVGMQSYLTGALRCRSVARVVKASNSKGWGSGFLVAGEGLGPGLAAHPALLVTNAHVVSDLPDDSSLALQSGQALVELRGLLVQGAEMTTLRVEKVLLTSPHHELDFTVALLADCPPAPDVYPLTNTLPAKYDLASGKLPNMQQRAFIIGHPGARREIALSLYDNAMVDYDERHLHYRTPTEGGNSGSPVFNTDWELIGLHHAGWDGTNGLRARLHGQPGEYPINEGIWIEAIRKKLAEALPAA